MSDASPLRTEVAPSPHLSDTALTTRRMMLDVLIALVPVLVMSVVVFRWHAVVQVGLCTITCVAAEAVWNWLQRRRAPIDDYSAVLTGMILGLSLPWSAPWYIAVIGSVAAIGFGKAVFGGLGCNIFNPAMVGRAFVMLSFAKQMGAGAYVTADNSLKVVTQATPLSAAKQFVANLAAGKLPAGEKFTEYSSSEAIWTLLDGRVNGSLGETSALAILIGGLYLCFRRVAAWQIPVGILITTFFLSELGYMAGLTFLGAPQHLITGALLFGAFFIATDPVTSPLTPLGKTLFGMGIGLAVVVIRLLSGYPEGVMFAVLLMNAVVPLINRWTIPQPVGGPVPQKT